MKWIGEFWDFSQRSHPVFDWIFQGIGEGDYTIMISSPFLDGNGMMFTHLDRLLLERRAKALVMVLTDQQGMDVALKGITTKRYTNFHGVLMDAATPQSSKPSESGLHSHSKIYCIYRNLIPQSRPGENQGDSESIRNRCHDFLNRISSRSAAAMLGDPVQGSFGSANFTEKGMLAGQDEIMTRSFDPDSVENLRRAFASKWAGANKANWAVHRF